MIKTWKGIVALLAGGRARLQSEPLIAGYRRTLPRGMVALAYATLVLAAVAYGFFFSLSAPQRMMPFTVPIALLGGLAIWGLPAGSFAPTRALEPILMAFLAALIIWPNYLAIALPSLPWVTLLRLLGVPMIVLFLVCISVSKHFRKKLSDVLNTDRLMMIFLVGIVVIQIFTTIISRDPGSSINLAIVFQVNCTCVFFISCVVFVRRGFAEFWVRMLLSMLIFLCFMGLWEARISHVPWGGHIPSFLRVEDEAVMRLLKGGARAATGIYRVQGTSTTSLGMAEVLGLAIPFAMHLAFERYRFLVRALGIAFIPLSVFLIVLTDSRLGVVAALLSVMFYLLIWALLRWRQQPKSLFGPAIVLTYPALFAAFVVSTFTVGRIRAQVWGDGSQQASTDSRLDQWAMAIPKLIRNPFGNGLGESGNVLGFTNPAGVLTVDSYYLTVLFDMGVAGFICYFGLIIRGIWVSTETVLTSSSEAEVRLLLPIAVSMTNFIVVKSVLSQDANHPLVFMMLGAVVALTYRSRHPTTPTAIEPVKA